MEMITTDEQENNHTHGWCKSVPVMAILTRREVTRASVDTGLAQTGVHGDLAVPSLRYQKKDIDSSNTSKNDLWLQQACLIASV